MTGTKYHVGQVVSLPYSVLAEVSSSDWIKVAIATIFYIALAIAIGKYLRHRQGSYEQDDAHQRFKLKVKRESYLSTSRKKFKKSVRRSSVKILSAESRQEVEQESIPDRSA